MFDIDINPAARIGKGIFLDHATGLVVGETRVIEDDVSILQGVTLGGTGKETGDRHPKIRQGVLIGAGAKILGNIEVGHCARVAAGSVVLAPVPHNKTVAGVPARIVGEAGCAEPARDMNQIIAEKLLDGGAEACAPPCRAPAFRGKPAGASARRGEGPMDKAEILELRAHLRRSFGAPGLKVTPNSRREEAADVQLGERKLGAIIVDDEDGDRSFSFEMKAPVERPVLQDYLPHCSRTTS